MNQKYKRPADCSTGRCSKESGGDLLSTGVRSIIGAEVFHGPVRYGKAWDPPRYGRRTPRR